MLESKILDKEIKDACLHQKKKKKSPGKHGITNEMIKSSLHTILPILNKLLNAVFLSGTYPKV